LALPLALLYFLHSFYVASRSFLFPSICFLPLPFHVLYFFFFNDPPPTEIYTLSLHDALPISLTPGHRPAAHTFRSSTECTRCWPSLRSTRSARPRVGTTFSRRFGPLIERQMPTAVSTASSSVRSA